MTTNKCWLFIGTLTGWVLFFILLFNTKYSYMMPRNFPSVGFPQVANDNPPIAFYTNGNMTIESHQTVVSPSDKGLDTSNPIPPKAELEKWTEPQLENFFHRYVGSSQAMCIFRERYGKITDGGWDVCLDPRYAPDPKDCLVYSFGINYEFSFDDAMANYGCEVHSFDPSMVKSKDHLRGKKVYFHKEGVSGRDVVQVRKPESWKLYTIGSIRKRLGHQVGKRKMDVLKMDVESSEKAALPAAFAEGSLADVPQLMFEVHGATNRREYLNILDWFRTAYDLGYRIFHMNRNMNCKWNSKQTGLTRTQCHEVYMVNIKLARQI